MTAAGLIFSVTTLVCGATIARLLRQLAVADHGEALASSADPTDSPTLLAEAPALQ